MYFVPFFRKECLTRQFSCAMLYLAMLLTMKILKTVLNSAVAYSLQDFMAIAVSYITFLACNS